MMGKHLVLCGAGHAHLAVLNRIPEYLRLGHRVTAINSKPYHYYSGMGPGLLSGLYRPHETRFDIKKLTEDRGASFIEDTVTTVRAGSREILLAGGSTIPFDVASFNIGSGIAPDILDVWHPDVLTVKPIENFYTVRRRLQNIGANRGSKPLSFVVVGGGAAGVESACNLWAATAGFSRQTSITLISRGTILKRFPRFVRRRALSSMLERGIGVMEGAVVLGNSGNTIRLAGGYTLAFDLALVSTGALPPEVFARSDIPCGPDGGMLVNEHLQSVRYPFLFGGGDCVSFGPGALEKVGVYAVRQSGILAVNIEAALEGKSLQKFRPQKRYVQLLNMGNRTALSNRRGPLSKGRGAFLLKDRIDRRFIRRFQLPEESGSANR